MSGLSVFAGCRRLAAICTPATKTVILTLELLISVPAYPTEKRVRRRRMRAARRRCCRCCDTNRFRTGDAANRGCISHDVAQKSWSERSRLKSPFFSPGWSTNRYIFNHTLKRYIQTKIDISHVSLDAFCCGYLKLATSWVVCCSKRLFFLFPAKSRNFLKGKTGFFFLRSWGRMQFRCGLPCELTWQIGLESNAEDVRDSMIAEYTSVWGSFSQLSFHPD